MAVVETLSQSFFVRALYRPLAQPRQTLTVAAASDLQAVMPDIAKRFERETEDSRDD